MILLDWIGLDGKLDLIGEINNSPNSSSRLIITWLIGRPRDSRPYFQQRDVSHPNLWSWVKSFLLTYIYLHGVLVDKPKWRCIDTARWRLLFVMKKRITRCIILLTWQTNPDKQGTAVAKLNELVKHLLHSSDRIRLSAEFIKLPTSSLKVAWNLALALKFYHWPNFITTIPVIESSRCYMLLKFLNNIQCWGHRIFYLEHWKVYKS